MSIVGGVKDAGNVQLEMKQMIVKATISSLVNFVHLVIKMFAL